MTESGEERSMKPMEVSVLGSGSGADVLDELDRVLKQGGGGNNGDGGSGNGGGDGGPGGDDPFANMPVNARMLIDTLKQVFALVERLAEKNANFTEQVAHLSRRTAGEILEAVKAEAEARASLTPILVRRFEAIEHNLQMVERHLGARYVDEDKGAGEDARSAS
jgi:hypothetical protein